MLTTEQIKQYREKYQIGKTSEEGLNIPNKEERKNIFQRIKSDITTAGQKAEEAISGTGEFEGRTSIRRGMEATAQAFNAIPKVAISAIPSPIGGDVIREKLSKVGEFLGKAVEKVSGKVGDIKALQEWTMKHPEATKNLEEILGTVSAGGEIAGDILAAEAGAKGLQKATDIGTEGVKAGLRKTGAITSKIGEKTYQSAFDLTAKEAQSVQNSRIKLKFLENEKAKFAPDSAEYADITKQIETAKAPIIRADTALEKGIMGTEKMVGKQAGVEKMDLWKNKVEPALKNSKATMTKEELFAKAAKTVADEADLTRKTMLQNAFDALQEDYAGFKGGDLLTMNEIKSSLAKFTPSKIFKGQEVASGVKTLQADMASAIREKIYSTLKDSNIKRAYIDYGNLKELEKVGIKALTEAGTKGGFGGFWTTLYNAATTPIKTVGGQTLYRIGNKLEFWGRKGIKTMGEHLDDKGIQITPATGIIQKGIEKYKNTPNKQGGFIKIGGETFKQIDTATKDEIRQIIKYLRGDFSEGIVNKNLEASIDRLAPKYNINQASSLKAMANKFEQLIEKTKTKEVIKRAVIKP